MSRTNAQRRADAYRRARRKLSARRRDGAVAVATYLAESQLARRACGLEAGRPDGIAGIELSPAELQAYQVASVAADADEPGGELAARSRRAESIERNLYLPQMKELVRRLFELGGHQVLTFGFADDSSRRVALLPNGLDIPVDGHEHTPIERLVERLFTDIHGCLITIRTEAGKTVNVYEAAESQFHAEPRREVFAAAVIGQVPVYFSGQDAERNLLNDPMTMSPLPRVPGTVYLDWPASVSCTVQEES